MKARPAIQNHKNQFQSIKKKASGWGLHPTVLLVIIIVLAYSQASRGESLASRNKEGNRFYAEGRFKDAENTYLDAQVKNPGRPEILYNLGNSLIKQKKYGEGFQALRQAIDKGDKGIKQNSWFNLGDGLFLMGDYKASADAFVEALKLDPADTDAKHNLELALRKLKEQEQQTQSAEEKDRQEEKKSTADSRQSAANTVDEESKQQEPPRRQQKRDGRFTEEQAIQLLEAIQNQEREEQRKALERRGLQRTNEKDW